MVELFFVVDVDLVVVSFLAFASFLVVAAVVFVVVIVSFLLLAHDVIKPKAAKTATDVIRDCFIGCG